MDGLPLSFHMDCLRDAYETLLPWSDCDWRYKSQGQIVEIVHEMVEGMFKRVVKHAERVRAATVIQRKWVDRVYRPDSTSSVLRGVKRKFAELQHS